MLRTARSLAYLHDMSRSLHCVCLAAGLLATFFNSLLTITITRHSSSAAESNLMAAAEALGKRQGDRVIMIVTDAESGEERDKTEPLWKTLAESRPRIFSIELHRGGMKEALAGQQDRMQDWAMANHGDYAFFRSGRDLDHALERAMCKVRRPAGYRLLAHLGQLEPGTLRVGRSSRAAAAAMELIIDVSGSMYRKLPDGRTRIAVAREAVSKVLAHSIPAGTLVALRVYGHRQPQKLSHRSRGAALATRALQDERHRAASEAQGPIPDADCSLPEQGGEGSRACEGAETGAPVHGWRGIVSR